MLGEAYETLEYEGLDDFEAWDFEDEALDEWAFEDLEPDRFLGDVFKKLARQAARTVGGAVAGRKGASLASMIANQVFREGEFETEYESEAEFEAEFEAAGGDLELLAEMEYYAELAAEAESEAEAAEFIGAIASLAGPLISSLLGQAEDEEYESYYEAEADPFLGSIVSAASSLLPKVIPFVKRGVQAVGRFLSRPGTRRVIRGIPRMVARTSMASFPLGSRCIC